MATEKAALRITELDFLTIRENLKQYLRSQSEFQDYDFEGSGLSVLLDILAYNTHYMAYYLNMTGNEMFIDSAQLRNSIISHAKLMNYVPSSSQGALSRFNVKITPSPSEDQITNSLTLEKYTRLLGTDVNGINHTFVTLYSNTAPKIDGSFNFSNVYVKQGDVVTFQYLMTPDNETRKFEIASSNVDTTTIVVTVQESTSNTETVLYTRAEDITELDANSTVYFIEENEKQGYNLYFGDNVLGKRPKDGNIIICTYLDNVGTISNNIINFTFTDEVGGKYADNISITSAVSSYGGSEKETIEQVRFRAPYFYSTQNRAVTGLDYETLILKDYNNIDSVAVWGGEDNVPVVYGKVYVSLKTKGNYALTNFEKEQIKEELIQKRNVLTVTPEIVDPDYIYIIVKGKIFYDSKLTSLKDDQLMPLVKAAISDYVDDELNNFSSIFRKNKLITYIENCEKSITGCDIDIFVQKRFEVDTNRARRYTVSFNLPLEPSILDNRLISYPEIQIRDSANVERNAYIEEKPVSKTGIKEISILNSGFNYISPPTINISGDGSGASATAELLGGRISKIKITNPGENYTYAIISIEGGEGSGASAKAILEKDISELRTFYYKTDGTKVIINDTNVGTIDYNNGIIDINSLRVFSVTENNFYDENYLTFISKLKSSVIYPLRNRIITIDENDPRSMQLQMVAE